MANQIDAKGQIAVVTGAAQGIGYAVAARLTQSGARVALWDRDEKLAQEASKSLAGSIVIKVEQSDAASVAAAAEATLKAFGRIDIMVNNAGIAGPNMPVADYPLDAWHDIININLNGVFYCCKYVVPTMKAQGYGRIVNIASIAGKEGNPNASAYSASKAGVIALTKSLGKELAKTGVCVNCVTPAAVKTGMFDQMSQSHIDFMLAKIPMGRFGLVEEIAAMVAWLCTDDCVFTTGAVFDLSGGRAVY